MRESKWVRVRAVWNILVGLGDTAINGYLEFQHLLVYTCARHRALLWKPLG